MKPIRVDPSPPETAAALRPAPGAEPGALGPEISGERVTRGFRRPLLLALKLAVTTAVCALILREVDWGTLRAELLAAQLGLIALAGGIRFLNVVLSAWKWQRILRVQGARYPLRRLVSWYFIGMFLSNLLPGSIGGDAYRVYRTRAMAGREGAAILAVFLERATGMAALLLVGYAAALLTWSRRGDDLSGWLALGGTLAIVAALVGVALGSRLRTPRQRWLRWPVRVVESVLRLLREFRTRPAEAALVAGISLLFHVNLVLALWLITSALDASIHLSELAVASTASVVAGALPISFGGLGVLDGTFVLFLGRYGIPAEQAFSTMLLSRALMLLSWVPGLLLYLGRERSPPDPVERATPAAAPELGGRRFPTSVPENQRSHS